MADLIKENISEITTNGTIKAQASAEGMAVAYGSLVVMALLPIFYGSLRSVKHITEKKAEELHLKKNFYHYNILRSFQYYNINGRVRLTPHRFLGDYPLNSTDVTKKQEMSNKDAAMFPIIASATLFGLYIIFQIFSKEYINLLLTFYFFCLGVSALCTLISPFMSKIMPSRIPKVPYHMQFTRGYSKDIKLLVDCRFSSHDIYCIICCSLFGAWYLMEKHWIANNIFGVAFATNGVELLHLNNIVTGCILLCGLFVYDIFWVFGTNVMVTVAKSFEAPIKLVFPQDFLEKGLAASNFAMLGLGDIVIPGIFIALLLRFDNSLKRNSKTYFYATFVAYTCGLIATMFVMHIFKRAQPALLYLVPACLGTPILLALIKGDLKAMLKYEDKSSREPKSKSKEVKKEPKKKK